MSSAEQFKSSDEGLIQAAIVPQTRMRLQQFPLEQTSNTMYSMMLPLNSAEQ
jgi:hypothetical protein